MGINAPTKLAKDKCAVDNGDEYCFCKGMCESHYRKQYRISRAKNTCECGCGTPVSNRFVSGHNARLFTAEEQSRRGRMNDGSALLDSGLGLSYRKVNQRHEHRQVVEAALGRKLASDAIVHHLNENKRDNRLENLEVVTRAEHARIHFSRKDA